MITKLRQFLTVTQILLVSLFENARRTVWRICILMLGCKGLREHLGNNLSVS